MSGPIMKGKFGPYPWILAGAVDDIEESTIDL